MYAVYILLFVWDVTAYCGFSPGANDTASLQLKIFKDRHPVPIGSISKTSGAPVEIREMNTLNKNLIFNEFFMETMMHFTRERIPERVVHASGAGAFGYFVVTKDLSDICNAKMFSRVGKKTPVAVRFSQVANQLGAPEPVRVVRGFAVKFYTEEGNFDLVTLNIPAFAINDPILFPSFARVQKRNPQTNLVDKNAFWDFFTLRPETMHLLMWSFSDFGIPYGFAYIRGFAIHTYQVYNDQRESYFVRFHLYPDWGTKTLSSEEAKKIAGEEPYFYTHQLYNDIANGKHPSWQMKIQILTLEDVVNADFNVFDITKAIPTDRYPLRTVGKLVLNKNPLNFFAEFEQLAYSPANLIPGVLGAPDKTFEARRLTYRDTQNYRLGANFHRIPVNCPFSFNHIKSSDGILDYLRDGRPPVHNLGNAPNYFFNSFNGPVAFVDKTIPELIVVNETGTVTYDQPRDLYLVMSEDEKTRLVDNIVDDLRKVYKFIQKRAIKIFYEIYSDLGERIERGLK